MLDFLLAFDTMRATYFLLFQKYGETLIFTYPNILYKGL